MLFVSGVPPEFLNGFFVNQNPWTHFDPEGLDTDKQLHEQQGQLQGQLGEAKGKYAQAKNKTEQGVAKKEVDRLQKQLDGINDRISKMEKTAAYIREEAKEATMFPKGGQARADAFNSLADNLDDSTAGFKAAYGTYQNHEAISNGAQMAVLTLLTMGSDEIVEGILALKGLGGVGESAITNSVPNELARVVPGKGPFKTLGSPGSADVFVTNPAAIAGMTPAQIAQRLGIPESDVYTIMRFPTPGSGVASPISRSNPGFVGGGLTTGKAPEFVVPNGPLPPGTSTEVIGH